jgi:hypothetical protein
MAMTNPKAATRSYRSEERLKRWKVEKQRGRKGCGSISQQRVPYVTGSHANKAVIIEVRQRGRGTLAETPSPHSTISEDRFTFTEEGFKSLESVEFEVKISMACLLLFPIALIKVKIPTSTCKFQS